MAVPAICPQAVSHYAGRSQCLSGVRLEVVGRIEHTDRGRSERLASWISSMMDLHRSKPPAAVSYSRPMPDLEVLMQVILLVANLRPTSLDCLPIDTSYQARDLLLGTACW